MGIAFDTIIVNGVPVAVLSVAPEAAFVANVKAALLKDSGVRSSLVQYGVGGSGSFRIYKGSVLAGTDYVGNAQVSITIPGVADGQAVAFLVYKMGSKTPTVVKPVKGKNGKYMATLPLPCSWYAIVG